MNLGELRKALKTLRDYPASYPLRLCMQDKDDADLFTRHDELRIINVVPVSSSRPYISIDVKEIMQ